MKCRRCDAWVPKDKLRCVSCGKWQVSVLQKHQASTDGTILLSDASIAPIERFDAGPWNDNFGGGIVAGSVTLIGGAPGAGKSTLSLQLCDILCNPVDVVEVLYIAAEEMASEVRSRALRLKVRHLDKIRVVPVREGFQNELGELILLRRPRAVIVDSLPGLVPDAETGLETCVRLKDYAIELKCPVVVIDHVTKADDFAGLKALQHAVDVLLTLFLRGDETDKRVMRTVKNRYGPNAETCFDMRETGLFVCPGCEYCDPDIEDDPDD